jgi:hypothetical protein
MFMAYCRMGVVGALGLAPQYCGGIHWALETTTRENEFHFSSRYPAGETTWFLTTSGRMPWYDQAFSGTARARAASAPRLTRFSRIAGRPRTKQNVARTPTAPQSRMRLGVSRSSSPPRASRHPSEAQIRSLAYSLPMGRWHLVRTPATAIPEK